MKIALVTGSNSGIGLLTSLELMKAGYTVIATMRNISNKHELVEKTEQLELTLLLDIQQMDVTNQTEIAAVQNYIEETYGELHVLVNNAGYCQGGFLNELTTAEWEAQQKTNVIGVFLVTKSFLPLLEKPQQSHIINVSSVSGIFGFPGMTPYCSSKFALEGFSESLRLELLAKKVFVSLVQPASYQTKIWNKGLAKIANSSLDKDLMKLTIVNYAKQAAKNAADPSEVARLIVKICQDQKPNFRYPIGKGAKTLSLAKRILPWSWIEKIVLYKLGKLKR